MDMNYLKERYGELLGIMVYVNSELGTSLENVKSICQSFYQFFDITISQLKDDPNAWDELTSVLKDFLKNEEKEA